MAKNLFANSDFDKATQVRNRLSQEMVIELRQYKNSKSYTFDLLKGVHDKKAKKLCNNIMDSYSQQIAAKNPTLDPKTVRTHFRKWVQQPPNFISNGIPWEKL